MRRRRMLRTRLGTIGLGLLALAMAAAGCSASPPSVAKSAPSTSKVIVAQTTILAVPAPGAAVTALQLLSSLAIKGRAPMTGYTRAQFGDAWTDDNDDPLGHNGCDTRNDILRRDLNPVTVDPASHGCTVLNGSLSDPYTAATIAFTRGATSTAIQIDHVVPLGDAWVTGAQQWTSQQRIDLGNDPLNLLAVSGPQNESKGDADAASWLPPNKAYRCAYVARQVAVKSKYKLWVTSAEHNAMAAILTVCPTQLAPVEGGSAAVESPTSAPPPTRSTVVSPGAYCSTAGASAASATGAAERCQTSPTDTRLRWRAA
jgi:hypothetical protein